MEISEESRKRISLNADTNTPSIVVLYFGRKFFIVVHRKRAIEMFSKSYRYRNKFWLEKTVNAFNFVCMSSKKVPP